MKKFILLVLFFTSFFIVSSTYATIAISPLKHEITVKQWQRVIKNIKITNESDAPITLYTSTEDFISWDNTGQPKFLKPEDQETPELSLANWIRITEKNITLAAWETREIKFAIKAPKNWEPWGHYWAIFFSPWIQWNGKVAFSQRIWVLLLIDVPWETIIDWNLESFEIGSAENETFVKNNSFETLPAIFKTNFKNNWTIHLKPKWRIELIDENWETLRNIGKETLSSPSWTFIWEKLVDYIPVNDFWGNVLPHSSREFYSNWEWFGYTVLNEDWTKTVNFKTLNEYYEDKASEKQAYLMFWEQIHTKKVKKKIIADYKISYESKDKKEKEFSEKKEFFIEYNQKYIWINYYVISWVGILVLIIAYFIIIHIPKSKVKKEKELRERIMNEINNNK